MTSVTQEEAIHASRKTACCSKQEIQFVLYYIGTRLGFPSMEGAERYFTSAWSGDYTDNGSPLAYMPLLAISSSGFPLSLKFHIHVPSTFCLALLWMGLGVAKARCYESDNKKWVAQLCRGHS